MSLLVKKSNGVDPFWSALDLNFWDPGQTFSSRFQVEESAEHYTISADMPGVMEDDLDISVKGNALTIKGQRKGRHQSYSKTYTIPTGADAANIEAKLDHGVLTVTIPKQPEAKPRRIQIKRE